MKRKKKPSLYIIFFLILYKFDKVLKINLKVSYHSKNVYFFRFPQGVRSEMVYIKLQAHVSDMSELPDPCQSSSHHHRAPWHQFSTNQNITGQ